MGKTLNELQLVKLLKEDLEDVGNKEEQKSYMEDVMRYGCQTGMVGHLIYYTDTVKFYNENKEEINELLTDALANTGLSISELFGDKWDDLDPLALEQQNQNLLAWFGYEQTVSKYYASLYDEF